MNKKGFTLIELLVTISIIGVLSTLAIISLQGTREEARITKLLSDATQIYRALGVNCLAHFDFENTANNTTPDSCGRQIGTVSGATTETGVDEKIAASFDGVDDYIELGNFDITSSGFTINTWFKADAWTNGAYHDGRLIDKSFNHYDNGIYWMLSTIAVNDKTRLRFRLRTDGNLTVLIANSGDLDLDKWYLATVTYDGSEMKIYLDGDLVGSTAKSGTIDTSVSSPVRIGNSSNGVRPWSGLIDNVRIYEEAAQLGQIQEWYNNAIEERKILVKNY